MGRILIFISLLENPTMLRDGVIRVIPVDMGDAPAKFFLALPEDFAYGRISHVAHLISKATVEIPIEKCALYVHGYSNLSPLFSSDSTMSPHEHR
jgi:hypothetical protein